MSERPEGPTSAGSEAPPPTSILRFSVEGRAAPGLFVGGWLATLLGIGALGVAMAAGESGVSVALSVAGWGLGALGLFLLGGSQTMERRAGALAYAGPSPLLVLLTVVAVSRFAGFAIGIPLAALGVTVSPEVGDLFAAVIQAAVFLGVVQAMVVAPGAMSVADLGLTRDRRDATRGLLTGAVFVGPVVLAAGIVAALAVRFIGAAPPSPLPPTGTPVGLVLHLVAGAVVAPVAEEVLFRGAILGAWWRTLGPWPAIVRSSLLFALVHVVFVTAGSFEEGARLALVGGLVRLPVAFALGWLYVRTGRLWAPIGLHALYNAILITFAESAAAG